MGAHDGAADGLPPVRPAPDCTRPTTHTADCRPPSVHATEAARHRRAAVAQRTYPGPSGSFYEFTGRLGTRHGNIAGARRNLWRGRSAANVGGPPEFRPHERTTLGSSDVSSLRPSPDAVRSLTAGSAPRSTPLRNLSQIAFRSIAT